MKSLFLSAAPHVCDLFKHKRKTQDTRCAEHVVERQSNLLLQKTEKKDSSLLLAFPLPLETNKPFSQQETKLEVK
jgi:hypothetical protein